MKEKAVIKAEMDKALSKEQSDSLWQESIERLTEFLTKYKWIPKGVHTHTDHFIFPSAAIYLTLKDAIGQESAYQIIEKAADANTKSMSALLRKAVSLPGMRDLFIRIWDPMTRKMFGPDSGFQNRFYPKEKDRFRVDIFACPYCRFFGELGCPELTKVFCENDVRMYGNLPGLKFERAGTLGTGADHCDFSIRKK